MRVSPNSPLYFVTKQIGRLAILQVWQRSKITSFGHTLASQVLMF